MIPQSITKETLYRNRDMGLEYQVLRCDCGVKYLVWEPHEWDRPMVSATDLAPVEVMYKQFVCIVCERGRIMLSQKAEVVDAF